MKRSLAAGGGGTDWSRFDRITDAEIEAAVADDPDAAPLADAAWFAGARVVEPPTTVAVSIDVDREVLEWFKAHGAPYRSTMGAVLREFVERERKLSGGR